MSNDRRTRKVSKRLEPTIADEFKIMVKNDIGKQSVLDFVHTISQVLDDSIEWGETWITIGVSKQVDKLVLTLHEGGNTSYAAGISLQEMLTATRSL